MKYHSRKGGFLSDLSHPSRGAWIEICPWGSRLPSVSSHPSRGAWIEIALSAVPLLGRLCRTPHGVRGLKSPGCSVPFVPVLSHPSRGAWIEIVRLAGVDTYVPASHPSRGAWIEISRRRRRGCCPPGRTPHGVRGLKFHRMRGTMGRSRRTPHGVRGLK